MSTDFSKPSSTKRISPAVTAAIWLFALGAPLLMLHANRVEMARREAEDGVLTEVAATLNSPSSKREVVMSLLERNQTELTDTRYVRTCNRLDIPMNWNTLFTNIRKRGRDEQEKAVRVIAQECRLKPGSTLKGEQMALALTTTRMVPMEPRKPIPMPIRAAVD